MAERECNRIDLTGRTILAVFAHPDDESLACGGTLARLADAGASVVLLCATRGENGSVCDPALVPDHDLGRVRSQEVRAAAEVLGLADVLIFDHPDGELRWADVAQLHAEIVATIRRLRPDGVITFAEDGLYWHQDHIGIHERTSTAVGSFGSEAPPLYYVTMPNGIMRELAAAAVAKGASPPDSSFWGIAPDVFGYSTHPPGFIVDVHEWVPRKLAALRCHRTQMGTRNPFTSIAADDARRWLGVEEFRRAPIESRWASALELLGEPVAGS